MKVGCSELKYLEINDAFMIKNINLYTIMCEKLKTQSEVERVKKLWIPDSLEKKKILQCDKAACHCCLKEKLKVHLGSASKIFLAALAKLPSVAQSILLFPPKNLLYSHFCSI